MADAAAINYYLGITEIIVATTFFLGFKVRLFSLLATVLVTMFFISFLLKFGITINPDLYRDIGLAGASLALFLLGAGPFSIDEVMHQKNAKSDQGKQKPQEEK